MPTDRTVRSTQRGVLRSRVRGSCESAAADAAVGYSSMLHTVE